MIAYKFTKPGTPVYGRAYPDILSALDGAKGSQLSRLELSGKIIEENSGLVAESVVVLESVDVSDVLRSFARRCAFRTLKTLSGANFAPSLEGVETWLNTNKINPTNWNCLVSWAEENHMMWMEGGHAEAAICNAVLAHTDDDEVHRHAWLAAEHAKRLFGKRIEVPRQRKSIVQALNKKLAFA